jgi:membrane-associated protease RseP (regulator of RpoE activity)
MNDQPTDQRDGERDRADRDDDDRARAPSRPPLGGWLVGHKQLLFAGVLFALTCVSTTWVGSWNDGSWISGLAFSVPLMSILLAHELGHYVAARVHHVPASLPLFIPMPISQIGTMGAVILMGERIASRNALLDIGAAGPLAGMAVALPVLIYGIADSPVAAMPVGLYLQEGHSLLYMALLRAIKGPFPEGQDILLTPTAFAGWVGLLVTMINLIPTLQLDGGHVAYALFGERYHRMSRLLRRALLPLGLLVVVLYGLPALQAGKSAADAFSDGLQPAVPWFVWWAVLSLFARGGGEHEHPRTDPGPLSPRRRWLARGTLLLFVLLFMPAWMRTVVP